MWSNDADLPPCRAARNRRSRSGPAPAGVHPGQCRAGRLPDVPLCPDRLRQEQAREMWLYFHGENTTTRLARSKDGIHFSYDKVVLSASMMPAGTTETSYAKVFEHELPAKGSKYVMVFMINTTANHRSIGWGR